ncbi:MAG: CDGSH iron-sulfur domain-containing protein [Thermoproteota archaeon]|nr:CDGSH iron-sulfur domain-containing protein [Thermoproteota archaeon]
MARLVRKEAKGPYELKNGTESTWICMCGLSDEQPFCNETHKKTADEKDEVYTYNKDNNTRTEVDSINNKDGTRTEV